MPRPRRPYAHPPDARPPDLGPSDLGPSGAKPLAAAVPDRASPPPAAGHAKSQGRARKGPTVAEDAAASPLLQTLVARFLTPVTAPAALTADPSAEPVEPAPDP